MPEPEGSSNSDDTVMDAGPAHVVEAPPADPMALDNFRLSDAVKQQLRAKKIESLFPIQAGQQMPSVLDALHTGSACTSAGHARVQDEILGTMHVRKGPPQKPYLLYRAFVMICSLLAMSLAAGPVSLP